jgi:hypothetical protein
MSLEKRGLILYEYCKLAYPEYKIQASIAWIEAGMSLKKTPAEKVKTKHQIPPEKWEVIYGGYKSNLRLCFLPLDENTKCGYWFGFETELLLKKLSRHEACTASIHCRKLENAGCRQHKTAINPREKYFNKIEPTTLSVFLFLSLSLWLYDITFGCMDNVQKQRGSIIQKRKE